MKFERAKVLLTDSEIHVLHKLKHVMTDNGYEVFRASTTAKLLLLLKFYNFDLICKIQKRMVLIFFFLLFIYK